MPRSNPLPITDRPILTASVGKNAEQFRDILRLYVPEGSVIADVTFGHGYFWKLVDNSKYTVLASDLSDRMFNPQVHAFDQFMRLQADMTRLPYRNESLDCMIIDPPYGRTGGLHKKSWKIGESYNLEQTSPGNMEAILGLYRSAAGEAARCLRYGGTAIVKFQDAIESGRQWWMHKLVREEFQGYGVFNKLLDMFVMIQEHTPVMAHKHQYHARKNHSYWFVLEKW